MIRLLGAITGSALALATLLVFVGVPQFKFDSTDSTDVEQSVVTLPLPTQPVEETVAPVVEPADVPLDTADEPLPEPPEPLVAAEPPVEADVVPDLGAPDYVSEVPEPGPADVPPLQPDSLNWYAFWSPFRSEIAATGFVDQLERVTGLDYRVVKLKPGVYEVAFAYSDDAEIAGNLSRISAATGLEMPEG